MTQLEQAKNASSDIQSKLDEVSTELSVTSTALEASKAEVLALQASKTESETAQTQAKEEVQSAQDKIEALEAQLNDLKSQAEQTVSEYIFLIDFFDRGLAGAELLIQLIFSLDKAMMNWLLFKPILPGPKQGHKLCV